MHDISRRLSNTVLRALGLLLLAAAMLVLPLSFATRYAATSESWWERGFERYDATGRSGLSQTEVLRVATETRDYLSNDDERLDVRVNDASFYSEREILHMIDVKVLLARFYDAGWAALGYVIFYVAALAIVFGRNLPRALARNVLTACGLSVAFVLVLGVIALVDFDSAFRQFHLVFFTNDLWQLSSRDGLIQLFPQRFFFDCALLIGGATFGTLVLLGGGSALYRWRLRRGGQTAVGEVS